MNVNAMDLNGCFMDEEAELVPQQSRDLNYIAFQNASNFQHSTPKEFASRFSLRRDDILPERRRFVQIAAIENSCNDKVKYDLKLRTETVHCTTKDNEPSDESFSLRVSTEEKQNKVLCTPTKEFRTRRMIIRQGLFNDEIRHNTPKKPELKSTTKGKALEKKAKINYGTLKGVNGTLEEDDGCLLWTNSSAKDLQHVTSAPQLPGNSEFEINNLNYGISLPQLSWISRRGSLQLQFWQRRLEVMNRKTEKMCKRDKELKDRLEKVRKRAEMLSRSTVITPVKTESRSATCINRGYDYKAKVERQIVRHSSNIYTCYLGNLIIKSPKRHSQCSYV